MLNIPIPRILYGPWENVERGKKGGTFKTFSVPEASVRAAGGGDLANIAPAKALLFFRGLVITEHGTVN